jgi:hypothetical protein
VAEAALMEGREGRRILMKKTRRFLLVQSMTQELWKRDGQSGGNQKDMRLLMRSHRHSPTSFQYHHQIREEFSTLPILFF